MAQTKRNIARWVLQGISVLGIFLGVGLGLVSIATPLSMSKDDFALLCFGIGISAIVLVVGAWLVRDCYRMLRGKSFVAIKSICGLLAFVFFGQFESWLRDLGTPFLGGGSHLGECIVVVSTLPALLAALLLYSVCVKQLNRLLKAAQGPGEPAETPHPAG